MRYKIGDQVCVTYGTLPLVGTVVHFDETRQKILVRFSANQQDWYSEDDLRHSTAAENKSHGSPFLRWAVVFSLDLFALEMVKSFRYYNERKSQTMTRHELLTGYWHGLWVEYE